MPLAPVIRRTIALQLALIMMLLPPLAHLNQARAEVPGVKKVLVVGGAAVGGIALLSMLFKRGAEVAVKNTAKAGVTGMLGGLFGKPWILIPVALGVGILAYYLWQKYWSPGAYGRDDYNRYNQTDGRRYSNPYYVQQVFGNQYSNLNPYNNIGLAATAGNLQANAIVPYPSANGLPSGNVMPSATAIPTSSGISFSSVPAAGGVPSPTAMSASYVPSFGDQIKSALSFGAWQPMQLAMASSTRANTSFFGGSGGLNLGGNTAFSIHSPPYVNGLGTAAVQGPNGISGTAFDLPNVGDPARLGRTDRIGRGLTNGDETLELNRTSLFGANAPVSSDSLAAAQAARDDAYTKMVAALKGTEDGSYSGDVQKAITDYRTADEALKAKQATASSN